MIALDVLVECHSIFQQYGLCLFQNFVKRHLNRSRLARCGFIRSLTGYIGKWLTQQIETESESQSESQSNESSESTLCQSSLVPDYIFLLSIIGTESFPRDLSSILDLHSIATKLTKLQMNSRAKSVNRIVTSVRYPYDGLVADSLLKILQNENQRSFIHFEHNEMGFSCIDLEDLEESQVSALTLNMTVNILILDKAIVLWTLKSSAMILSVRVQEDMTLALCLETVENVDSGNAAKIVLLRNVKLSFGRWQSLTFVLNLKSRGKKLRFEVYCDGESVENETVSLSATISPILSMVIGGDEGDVSVSFSEWKLWRAQIFGNALNRNTISNLVHFRDRFVYRNSMDLQKTNFLYSISADFSDPENERIFNLIDNEEIGFSGDLSVSKQRTLSSTLMAIGGIPILFDLMETALTTHALNRWLEVIGELMDEMTDWTVWLRAINPMPSHFDSIDLLALTLRSTIHLADGHTVSLLLRLCGLDHDFDQNLNSKQKVQRRIFRLIFLDEGHLRVFHSKQIRTDTICAVLRSLSNLVLVHRSKTEFISFLLENNAMKWILGLFECALFTATMMNRGLDFLKCLVLNAKSKSDALRLVMDSVIAIKVALDRYPQNENESDSEIDISSKTKLNLLLKLVLDLTTKSNDKSNIKTDAESIRISEILSLSTIISLIPSSGSSIDDKLTAKYLCLFAADILFSASSERLLALRDDGSVMALVQALNPLICCDEIAVILMFLFIGKRIDFETLHDIEWNSLSVDSLLDDNVDQILLPEVLLVVLLRSDSGSLCFRILKTIKNWGSGCTLALVLDMGQLIFSLSTNRVIDRSPVNESSNSNDMNLECDLKESTDAALYLVNKAVRQLLKTQVCGVVTCCEMSVDADIQ